MAIPKWLLNEAQRDIDAGLTSYDSLGEEAKRSLRPPTQEAQRLRDDNQAMLNINQADQTAKNRRIVDGIDPALANVKKPTIFPSALLPKPKEQFGLMADYFLNRPREAMLAPVVQQSNLPKEDRLKGGLLGKGTVREIMAGLSGERKDATGSNVLGSLGWQGEGLGKELAGGLIDIAGTPAFSPIIKGGQALTKSLPIVNKLGKSLAGSGAAGGIYGTLEGMGNQETPLDIAKSAALNAAAWPVMELGLKGAGAGIKAGLGKVRGKGELPKMDRDIAPEDMDWIPENPNSGEYSWKKPTLMLPEGKGGEPYSNIPNWEFGKGIPPRVTPDFTVGPLGRTHIGEPQLELPAGPQRLMLGAGKQPLVLPASKAPLALREGYTPNWEIGRQPTKEEVARTLARQQKEVVGKLIQNNSGKKPRVEGYDPNFSQKTQAKYDSILKKEQDYLLQNAKKGVESKRGIYDQEGNNLGWNKGFSKNDEWYRNLYKELGREPSQKEIRAYAERTLREGHDDIPPDADFLRAEAELKAEKRLPEEWHVLNSEAARLRWENPMDADIDKLALQMEKQRDSIGFKYATSTAKKAVSDANKAFDIGAKDLDRIVLDEPAMARPDMQLADKVANALSNTSIVTAKMPSHMQKVQGFFVHDGKKIVLNSNMEDPATYVTLHEAGHKMAVEFPEQYGKMLDIAVNNLKDDHKGLIERYKGRGYEIEDMPDEFFNDLMAEMLHDKSFVGKLHDQAPEVIKPLLKVLDDLIAKVKLALSKDDSVLPFIQNLEKLRAELAPEYRGYLETVGERQGNSIGRGVAAKQGNAGINLKQKQPTTEAEKAQALITASAGKLSKSNMKYGEWARQMIAEHGTTIEKNLPYIWHRSQELLTNGTTTIKIGGQELPVKMPGEGQPRDVGQTNANKQVADIKRHIENTKKATKYDGNEPARAARIKELEGDLLKAQAGTYKDISGFQADTQDVSRNFRDFYGKDVELEEGSILDSFNRSKGQKVDYENQWLEKLKEVTDGLGINKGSKLSGLAQRYGEGGTKENPYTYAELVNDVGVEDAAKVVQAENWFRESYDKIIEDVNRVVAEIYPNKPDKLVPKRKDYFRHFQEMGGFEGVKNLLGSPAAISPELAGRSDFTLPKTKWASFKQRRGMGPYKEDAVGGFLNYLPAASYSIHIDPHIGKFEGLASDLANATEKSRDANNFIEYLRDYSRDLAGKTNAWDRKTQKVIGRKAMGFLTWLNDRTKKNAVMMNLGSALSQPLNIPNGVAFAKQHAVKGTGRAITNIFREDPARNKSLFMKERFGLAKNYRQFETGFLKKPEQFASWLLETSDRIGTEIIWQSCYQKGLNTKGVIDPVKYADINTRRLVAGRGIGEQALIQKSKLFQIAAPFQVEVGNLWKVQRDFVKEKDFAGLATLMVGLWMANNVSEAIRGQRIVFDPIDATAGAIKDWQADTESGIGKKAIKTLGRLGGEVLSNVPLGQTAAALYPEFGLETVGMKAPTRKELFGDNDPTRYGTGPLLAKAVTDPGKYLLLPYGGAQADKTINGLVDLRKGGSYKDDKLRYPVSNDSVNATKGVLFGPAGFRENKPFYDNDRRTLGTNQTKQVEGSGDRQAQYDFIMKQRKIESIVEKAKEIGKDPKLTQPQKEQRIQKLWQEVDKLRAEQ